MINEIKKNNKFDINSLYFYFFIFILVFIIFRIILPYGDEPDYYHRYTMYLLNFNEFHVYQYNFNQGLTCNAIFLESGLFSFLSKISPYFCNSNLDDNIKRLFIGFILNIIYFLFIFFIFKNLRILKTLNLNNKYNNLNLHIFFCSMIYPTVIYYLGTRSNEIFLFYTVLLFFLVWRNIIISYLLAFLSLKIDYGNGGIFFLFVNFFYLFRYSLNFLTLKKLLITISLIVIFLVIFERQIQNGLSSFFLISNTDYLQNISKYVLDHEKNFIVPNYFKLIITYFSFVFLTPGFLKSTILLILMTILVIYVISIITEYYPSDNYKKLKKIRSFNDYIINSYAAISFVLLVVLIFPTHSFIRYYIFIYPFIFSLFFLVIGPRKTFYLSVFGTTALIAEISIYRILFYL